MALLFSSFGAILVAKVGSAHPTRQTSLGRLLGRVIYYN